MKKKEITSRPNKAQNKMFSFLVYVKICLLRHIRGMCTAVQYTLNKQARGSSSYIMFLDLYVKICLEVLVQG